jgi:hypothetical protein
VTVLDAGVLGGDTDVRLNVFKFAGLLRPTRFKSAVLLAAATVAGSVCLPRIHGVHARPKSARWTAEQVGRRMLALCDAYKGRCTLEGLPSYYGDAWMPTSKRLRHRSYWVGFVHADGQMLELVLNDKTGNLGNVLNGGEMATAADGLQVNGGIKTPAQAARLSMHLVRTLQMIPRKADVALVGIPSVIHREKAWQVTWRVWDKPMAAAYLVKVALRQHDGHLMDAANVQEEALCSAW